MHFYMLYDSSNYTFGSVCHFLKHWTIFGKGALKHSFFSIADDYYDDKISVVSSLGAGVQKDIENWSKMLVNISDHKYID